MNSQLRQRLEKCSTLPTLPAVAIRIVELCRQQDVDLRKLAEAIGQDPVLCARVLKVVNSAFYCFPRQIETLSHAVAILGIDAVRTIALAFSLVRGMRGNEVQGFDFQAFWRRSLFSAVSAQCLGKWSKMRNEEVLFLAGLMQDIGMLFLRELAPKDYGELFLQSNGTHRQLAKLEKTLFGEDHSAVSRWLAQTWGLPEVFEATLRFSHDPDNREVNSELIPTVQIIGLSGLFADIWLSEDVAKATETARAKARWTLDMDHQEVQEVCTRIALMTPSLSAVFKIDMNDTEVINKTLEKAKDALLSVSIHSIQRVQELQVETQSLSSENQTLTHQLSKDALTGLYNRAYLDERMLHLIESSLPLSLVFCDVDHFKQINDTYGHPVEDCLLQAIAQILEIRVGDKGEVIRFGGDEFVVLLPQTPTATAVEISNLLCNEVASKSHSVSPDQSIQVTTSFGCATHSIKGDFETSEDLLEAADQAPYLAKQGGKNQVGVYSAELKATAMQ
jgi:diguanylate cyclase (GGDEF)-like protein